jgi:enoyl-CoA hydratase/carnithine racemase
MTTSVAVDAGIATITLDDGKVNALGSARVQELHAALESASSCRAVVLTGRPGFFTAGLDTRELEALDVDGRVALFTQFGRLLLDMWVLPCPVVCAVTGHAIAAGTLLALAGDHVVAAEGDYRWGMTEAQIGLELSDFSILLVRNRVAPFDVDRLLLQGLVVDPRAAVEVGYAHETAPVDAVLPRALDVARALSRLPAPAYARNKLRLRADRAQRALDNLGDDMARLIASQVVAPEAEPAC